MNEYSEQETKSKNLLIWFIAVIIVAGIVVSLVNRTGRTVSTGIVRYEQFYEIYEAAKQVDINLCDIARIPGDDQMFSQISKASQINAQRLRLNRIIADYNAKSSAGTYSVWKGSGIPRTLSTNQFTCY